MPRERSRTLRAVRGAAAGVCGTWIGVAGVGVAGLSVVGAGQATGAITFSVTGTWDTQARRDAAVAAMTTAVAMYNDYGTFNKSITVTYNSGVATADANYNGSIRFGGTWPGVRVSLHEISHTLGVGTTSNYTSRIVGGRWTGARASALARQFDGDQATLNGDSAHFWPYGLNYDSEASSINNLRHVAMVYALRADMGLGPTAHPSAATSVTLTASDALGTSGFNHPTTWSDGHFPHAGADYATGNFAVRTPASPNSFTFAGDSLTLNNRTDTNGGLYYKGSGTGGVITISDLVLDGGWIHHLSASGDVFKLAGRVTVASASTIRAKQGNIEILAPLHGSGNLTIPTNDFGSTDNGYVRFVSPSSTYTGSLDIAGRFELKDDASFRFVIGASGVNNVIGGTSARRVRLDGDFELDLAGATSARGDYWRLVTAANVTYGSTFTVRGFTEVMPGFWTDGRYNFSEFSGILTPARAIIPEPGALVVPGIAGLMLGRRRR